MGLAYIVSIVSLFDEYVNDLLYLREGSRLPRYTLECPLSFFTVPHPPPLPPSLFFFFFFFFSLLRSKKQACFRNSLANDFAEDRGDEMGILENLKSSS